MCLRFQTRIQLWFERVFSRWADIVTKRTLLVFLLSMLVFGGLSKCRSYFIDRIIDALSFFAGSGIMFAKQFEDQTLIWTPSVSAIILRI